ncbi:LexA family protein [Kushneria phosphatilytica]|uniref:Translesion error-prone DNA polymerase V autoproteolytic subunit n=1 Tax=Kushneria phosphatilytica TaxID=657387 RepID=A0A1S1NXY2_9GAMM|nr:translesion error-prone DNA polymerase V autoproteolytic subunit [Kushneria phosphatilytica]OHV11263.1 UV protection and mutation protein [Kushneria phosphatilytica]QEL12242.1 translesion error-prone DNA polymerase V autoproteolytic subunit [Kushneria phosphatilytica]
MRLIDQHPMTVDPPRRSIPWAIFHVRAGLAGFPSPAQDYDGGSIDLNEQLIPHPTATFMFTAQGDSMSRADGSGICNGDRLLVDRSLDATHGDIVVAVVDGELVVKELRTKGGRPALHSANTCYAPIPLLDRDVQIWGVVTNVLRTLRR